MGFDNIGIKPCTSCKVRGDQFANDFGKAKDAWSVARLLKDTFHSEVGTYQ